MKKTLLTLGALTLLISPSVFAVEDSLQEHLRMEQKLKQQAQKRLKDGSVENNQYKHQNQYQGINSNRSSMGSRGGQRSGGGGRR